MQLTVVVPCVTVLVALVAWLGFALWLVERHADRAIEIIRVNGEVLPPWVPVPVAPVGPRSSPLATMTFWPVGSRASDWLERRRDHRPGPATVTVTF